MKKIVVIGGLGYIGTELCKLLSGESWYHNIIVIDSRFMSDKVRQIRDWGMEFIQGSILDEDLLSNVLKDSDIVYHLAGITDVAYTKTESNKEKDDEIKRVGIDGTRNVIKHTPKNAKIIFPSTHVVYEGFETTMFDLEESVPTKPVLTYSTGKDVSEKDLFTSDKNFIIMRLSSVYGLSSDTMRTNIMPNLFSKITSQNGVIKLFSGGIQIKSLVSVFDVVRAMKHLSESNYNREFFHISKENVTIKSVAEICKKINPKVSIIETEDEIPNLGYTISNKKLLSTGFEFKYNLETCIKEMINSWSKKDLLDDLEFKLKGGKEFIDDRGKILNYELTEPINLIGYIESKKGTIRANHYHPVQEQKCLLIKGKYISVTKNLMDENSIIETRIINEGDIAVIKPNVAHTMVFTEDSIFLNLVRGEREHENYGITHTIPYKLVDDKLRDILLNNYKMECRSCGNTEMLDVISLGLSPLANNLINNTSDDISKYPLELKHCEKCFNTQLSCVVEQEKMFDEYLYLSSTTNSFKDHFNIAAEKYIKDFNLNEESLVIDIGSNDGIALRKFKEKNINVLGVEPAKNVSLIANESGINTINGYFDDKTCNYILSNYKLSDLILASNVFAHSDYLKSITHNAFKLLKDGGTFIVEVQYLKNTIEDLTFDNIYHEHVNYWSLNSIIHFMNNLCYCVYNSEWVNTHGGSIRVYISKTKQEMTTSLIDMINDEKNSKINDYDVLKTFKKSVESLKNNTLSNIKKLKDSGKVIACYGSPAKATTLLNYFGIDDRYISYTIEDNKLKQGKYIPGVNIPIVSKTHSLENLPNVVIVLAWNFYDEIVKNNKDLIEKGVEFINIKDLSR